MNKNFIALLSLILVGISYPFFLKTLWNEIGLLRIDIANLEETLAKVSVFTEKRDELLRRYETFTTTDLTRLDRFLPEDLDVNQIVLDIYNIGLRNGFIMIGGVSVVPPTPLPVGTAVSPEEANIFFDTTEIGFNVVGPYSGLTSLLNDLAASLSIFDITSLTFVSDPKGIYNYSFKINTYELKNLP